MSQIDLLQQEVVKKDSESMVLQTKLDTLEKQNSDCKQHIEVLKESLIAKEHRAYILQTEASISIEHKFTHIFHTFHTHK